MPEVDLLEVAKLCVAPLMLALTLGVVGVLAAAVVQAFRDGDA